ncbi:MAG: GAF domain-containing protein [Candidatus Krumholzibacteria bacterium]|nr:GAF domain-containing protein [Candidatus Krumholzibacteria bacterium]MDH4338018.1 GAF domain-containing protein [Candidatus Krumholzibacteria bacterium]MDH5270597.1 GAF domain-containing protein [Candidatus Krumholzibacteria bacterium]
MSILYLRFIELFAFFGIVFAARFLGDFTYPTNALVVVFLAAAFLQYIGEWVWELIGQHFGWDKKRRNGALLWYSSYVDLAAVIALIKLTGTIESPFLFMLTIPLFFVCNTFPWKTTVACFVSASIAALAALAVLEMNGTISHQTVYHNAPGVYQNAHFVAGSLLVMTAFVSLVIFLSNAFQDRMNVSLERLRRKKQETESRIDELTRLYDITTGINAAMSLETLLRIVAKEVTLLLNRPWASIVLFNQKQEITHSVFVGITPTRESKIEKRMRRGGLSEWIWTHNTPIVVEDTTRDKRANCSEFLNHFDIRSLVGFPLTTGRQVIGVIYTGDFLPKSITEQHMRLLTTLSQQLSNGIEKSRLYDSLERKIRDLDRQMETLQKANILKSDFVSHVSHELRTPLTSIKAYVETLANNIEDPTFVQRREFLDIVHKETNRLIRIVNDVLDVSKIEFGQRPVSRSAIALHAVVEEVLSMLSPSLKERDVTVSVNVPDSLPRVDGDADLIKQVFINLISNALKYSPRGTTITVRAREEAVSLVVSVSDQGIGIPRDEIGNVFDKYFRARSQVSAKMEGLGLGLAIVKNIVEQHGGSVRVESEENVGSTFSFTLPREACFNDLIGYIGEIVDAREQLHEMLELIVKMIAELLNAKRVSLMLLDKSRQELFIKMSYGLEEWVVESTRVKVGQGIAGKVAANGEPLLISNIEENEVFTAPNNPQYETMSLVTVPLRVNDVIVGVINVNNKLSGAPFDHDDLNLLMSFSERISRALERVRMVEDSHSFLQDTIDAFRRMLETQTKTKVIEQAVDHALKIARKMRLSEKDVSVVQYVASVHDIGMTEISDEILNKTLNLSSEEMMRIQRHPERGAELIRPLEFVEAVSNIILYHHERYDGTGYPMGLKGEEIPVGARILAVIDAFQSMTIGRPYRTRKTVEEAVQEIVKNAGSQFDREVVEAFILVLREDGKLSSREEKESKRRLGGTPVGAPKG